MKFRVIFLKKKHIYYALISLILVIMLVVLLLSSKASPTFNTLVDNNKLVKADLTGDGKEDILYIKTEQDKYYMEVNTGEKSIYLEPDKKLPSVGLYDTANPLKVTLMDITRDKTPEIFVQSYQKEKALQHVFSWSGDKFNDIYCGSSNNIIGFADCSTNKTPKFLTGKMGANKIEFTSYIFMPDKNKLESFTFNYKNNYMGRDSIFAFIKYVEALPSSEPNMPSNIFYPGLSGQELSGIGKLAGDNNTYTFQNCTFKDSKSDKNGEILEVSWVLNFKAVSNTDKTKVTNYTVNLRLSPDGKTEDNNYFKINSIAIEQ